MDDRQEVVGGLLRSYLFEGMSAWRSSRLRQRPRRGGWYGASMSFIWATGRRAICCAVGRGEGLVVDINGHEVIHFMHGPGMTLGEPGFFRQEHYRILDSSP